MPIDFPTYVQLSSKQKKEVTLVDDAYRMSSSAKADFMRKALEWYRKYNMWIRKPEKKENQRRARTASPLSYTMVEHATASMKSVLFPANANEPVIKTRPQGPSDIDNAQAVEQLINYQLTQSYIRLKGEIWLRNFNIFGVGIIYPYWKRIIKKRKIRYPLEIVDPFTQRKVKVGLGPPQMQEIIEIDEPCFDVGDIEDFFPDPAARSFLPEDMRYVVRIFHKSYEALKLEVESNPEFYDKSAFNMIKKTDIPPLRKDDTFSQEITRYHQYDTDSDHRAREGMVEIKFYMSDDKFIMIANDTIPIMSIDNPYWIGRKPCIVATRLPITNYPWGKGKIEPIDKSIEAEQAITNATLDTINLSINPPWITRRGIVDKTVLRNIPNNILEIMGSMDDIKKLEVQDTTTPGLNLKEILRRDIEITEPSLGLGQGNIPANIRSFGQQSSFIEKVTERDQMDIDNFAETGLKPLAQWFYSMDQMFIDEDKLIRILENDALKWVPVGPEELLGNYDFEVVASAKTTPKAVEAQQRFAFIQQIAPILQNPATLTDGTLDIIAEVAKDIGYHKIAKLLRDIAIEVRLAKISQQIDVFSQPDANSPQALQGASGGLARNTDIQNTPLSEESLMRQIAQNSTTDEFGVI
jgi:hypothetical protein